MKVEAPWSPILTFLLIILANVGPTLMKTPDKIRSQKYLRQPPRSPHYHGFVIHSKTKKVLPNPTQSGFRCPDGGVGYYQDFADRQMNHAMGHDDEMKPTGSGWSMSTGDSDQDGGDWIGGLGTIGLLGLIGLKSLVLPFALLLPLLPLLQIIFPALILPLLLPLLLPVLFPILPLLLLLLPVPVVLIPNPGLPTAPGATTTTTTTTTPTTVPTTPSTTTTTRTPVPICGIPVGVTPPVGTACDCSSTPATMVCRCGTTTDTCLCDAVGNNCACTDNTGVATLAPTCQAMLRRNRPVRGRGRSILDPEYQHHSNNTRSGTYR